MGLRQFPLESGIEICAFFQRIPRAIFLEPVDQGTPSYEKMIPALALLGCRKSVARQLLRYSDETTLIAEQGKED